MSDERTVNIKQAVEYAGVCRRTIHYWIKKQRVKVVTTPSGRKRILLSSLEPKPQDKAQDRATDTHS